MQNIIKRCQEITGADIPGLADNWHLAIDIGGRCSFPIVRYYQYNWKSIAPHGIDRYWRGMQFSN